MLARACTTYRTLLALDRVRLKALSREPWRLPTHPYRRIRHTVPGTSNRETDVVLARHRLDAVRATAVDGGVNIRPADAKVRFSSRLPVRLPSGLRASSNWQAGRLKYLAAAVRQY